MNYPDRTVLSTGDTIAGKTSLEVGTPDVNGDMITAKVDARYSLGPGVLNLISSLASSLLHIMVGSLIVSGASFIKGIVKFNKASIVRREEIMKDLLAGKKDLEEDVELITADYLINLLG